MVEDAGRRHRKLALLYASTLIALIVAADRGSLDVSWLSRVPAVDKLGHFLLIGLLSYLVNTGFEGRRLRWKRLSMLEGSLLVAALVAVEELSQLWLLHRSFELADLVADLAGIWVFGRLASRGPAERRRRDSAAQFGGPSGGSRPSRCSRF